VTPDADLAAAREATGRLLDLVERTPDLRAPSLLPGWSRAHVVAHVAGNAEGQIRMLRAAQQGEVGDQYPGGAPARAAAIEELAADPRAAVEALRRTARELDAAWAETEDWSAPARPLHGDLMPVWRLPWTRWREVEVHAVDLGGDYRPPDWPEPFVLRLLEELRGWPALPSLTGIAGPDHALAAWLTGRSRGEGLTGDLPDLPEWR
jgi:maleylpyruvate isomerase